VLVTSLPPLEDIYEDYDLLEGEDRYRLLIDLGRELEPMPDALKTDATKVRGCSASVWVYPTSTDDGRLHFLGDHQGYRRVDPFSRPGQAGEGGRAIGHNRSAGAL
jgi:sulfur transfer protein SufE